jgi:hypothetical protein
VHTFPVSITRKFRTLIAVYTTFGKHGVIRLIAEKRSKRSSTDKTLIGDFVRLGYAPIVLNSEKLSEIIDTPNLFGFETEYFSLRTDWSELFKAPREQFFEQVFDLGDSMGLLIYCYVRSKKPRLIIETGVAAGVSSSILLEALRLNGSPGDLVSIDVTEKVGEVIPNNLRSSWTLEVLDYRNQESSLVNLLRSYNSSEIFLHDSDHSNAWQITEFKEAFVNLEKCEVFFFDDISPVLIQYVKTNHSELKIHVLDEGQKFSGVFLK